MLDLARIESGTIDLHIESINCNELLDEVAVELKPLAAAKSIALEVRTSGEPLVHSDRRSLRQILIIRLSLTRRVQRHSPLGGLPLEDTHTDYLLPTDVGVIAALVAYS